MKELGIDDVERRTQVVGVTGQDAQQDAQQDAKQAMGQTAPAAIATSGTADTAADVLRRLLDTNDQDRLKLGAMLVNLFNQAIQRQAGRQLWDETDYKRFINALIALDAIGSDIVAGSRVEADIRNAVGSIQRNSGNALPQNKL